MALDEVGVSGTLAIGIGCRSGVAADAIVALVRDTLANAALSVSGTTLCSVDAKAGESGLKKAAAQIGARLILFAQEELAAIETPTRSPASLARFGIGSVAESAALAGAGANATLLVKRVARDGVTCAVARAP